MQRAAIQFGGILLPLFLWLGTKSAFDISDRYLPGFTSIVNAVTDLGWPLALHTAATVARTLIGFILGVAGGVVLTLVSFRLRLLPLLMPTVHAFRAVPAVATVPFFLLWFGFSETGRYLLVALGLGLNVMVAWAFPAVAVPMLAGLGAVAAAAGVTEFDAADAGPVPTALVAVTVNV